MHWLIAHLPAWNSWLAFALYWLPLVLCTYWYTLRFFREWHGDYTQRAAHEVDPSKFYAPSLRLGDVVAYLLLVVTPAANLYAAVFNVAPELLPGFFRLLGRVLEMPLVPARDRKPDSRA